MGKGPIEKLLLQDEYKETVTEIIIVEGQFVELDQRGYAIDLVWLALSENYFYLARRLFPNWDDIDPRQMCLLHTSPSNEHLDVEGLQLKTIIPISCMKISVLDHGYFLKITTKHHQARYFELCTLQGRDTLWSKWLKRVVHLYGDRRDCSSLKLMRDLSAPSSMNGTRLISVNETGKDKRSKNRLILHMENLDDPDLSRWMNAMESTR